MLKQSPFLFALARRLRQTGPRTSGLLWFACWLCTGDLRGCVAVLTVGCVLCTAVLIKGGHLSEKSQFKRFNWLLETQQSCASKRFLGGKKRGFVGRFKQVNRKSI